MKKCDVYDTTPVIGTFQCYSNMEASFYKCFIVHDIVMWLVSVLCMVEGKEGNENMKKVTQIKKEEEKLKETL